jgi:hypothetical protein
MNTGSSVTTTTKSRHSRASGPKAQKLPLLQIPTRTLDEEWRSSGVATRISNRRPKVGSSSLAPSSQSFVTKVIESSLGSESPIFVTGFVGSVRWSLWRLLLLVGAIAKAKATAGTLPCSKM